jgi:hypothetical protein
MEDAIWRVSHRPVRDFDRAIEPIAFLRDSAHAAKASRRSDESNLASQR